MKKKDILERYRSTAQGLDDFTKAIEVLTELYKEVHFTFAETLGEVGLSHEFDKGGRFHDISLNFDAQCRRFEGLQSKLEAQVLAYALWRKTGIERLN